MTGLIKKTTFSRLKNVINNYDLMPKKRNVTIYAGRLNFTPQKPSVSEQEIEKTIKDLLTNNEILLPKGDFLWRFGNIDFRKETALGQFGQIKKTKDRAEFDEERRAFVVRHGEKGEAHYSNFCIYLKEHLILYESEFAVRYLCFKNMFEEIFNKSFGEFVKLE